MNTIGVLHPGEMGAAIGASARTAGGEVLWAPEGRSPETTRRAEEAGLEAVSFPKLLERCQVVLSVCPPHAALAVAGEVAGRGFDGIFVDANAISPETARAVAQTVSEGGGRYVDGGIIGPPPMKPGTTTLCLSGPEALRVGSLFEGSALDARLLGEGNETASALKMCFAAWSKGSTALLLAVLSTAEAHGLAGELFEQWDQYQPGLRERAESAAGDAQRKAWRWVAEMREIERTLETAGLPGGFHGAAAEIYARMSGAENPPRDADAVRILGKLRSGGN